MAFYILLRTQGGGALRLCPGLLCYAPSGRLNARFGALRF